MRDEDIVAHIGGWRPCCADERESSARTSQARHAAARAHWQLGARALRARTLGAHDLGKARVDPETEGGGQPEARHRGWRARRRVRHATSRRGVGWPDCVPLYPCSNA
jgi:hypothetical protein